MFQIFSLACLFENVANTQTGLSDSPDKKEAVVWSLFFVWCARKKRFNVVGVALFLFENGLSETLNQSIGLT